MMKKAREVIAEYLYEDHIEYDEDDAISHANTIIRDLSEAGFVILPKEPTEGMLLAAEIGALSSKKYEQRFFDRAYRAMISHAEGDKG